MDARRAPVFREVSFFDWSTARCPGIVNTLIVTTNLSPGRLAAYGRLAGHLGPGWVLSRAKNAVDRRFGLLERRLPSRGWAPYRSAAAVSRAHRSAIVGLPVDREALAAHARSESPAALAALASDIDELRKGRLRYFSGALVECGWPPDWWRNVPEELAGPDPMHFSRIGTFRYGDIKNIWEPGRFGFAWTLARGAAAGVAPDASRLFFQAVESFTDANPPFDGPHWMCGQEATFRGLAVLGGWSAFHEAASASDAERVAALLVATAERIVSHIDYALSQRNNHGLSEALGLLLIGSALRHDPRADGWRRRGVRLLEDETPRLVYPDGGFSQHSATYHRVMMQVLSVAMSVSGALSIEVPHTRAALERAVGLARALVRPDGTQARYGHDDGALVLPWTSCAYDDFRPAIQEALAVLGRPLAFPPGPWDAGVVWLGHAARLRDPRAIPPAVNQRAHFRHAGIVQLRDGETSVQLRVPSPRHRPSHLDTLHVDVWWRDVDLAIDRGTYSYNGRAPFDEIPLAAGGAHNVVHQPGADQGRRMGRFLFWPWPAADVRRISDTSVVAEYRGRLGTIRRWQRSIRVFRFGGCVVADRVELPPGDNAELRWHLADLPNITPRGVRDRIVLDTAHGPLTTAFICGPHAAVADAVVRRAESGSTEGWRSPRYQQLTPCWGVTVPGASAGTQPLYFVTLFVPGLADVAKTTDGWQVSTSSGDHSDRWWPDAGADA
jgi:Heparinase II/III-like protein/Heparinase II/III N-terminus